MDCVNHSGVSAAAYCQNCGKALCSECVRKTPADQIFCEPCWIAWQGAQRPFVPPPAGAPSPGLAAFLGLIPGVGAMYNGQFIKGLVHVFIFAVLVSAAHVYGIFGLFIAGWVFYQVFEAYYTAKARCCGEPLPDPLGLNEVSNWFMPGGRVQQGAQPGAQPGAGVGPASTGPAGSYQAPYQAALSGAECAATARICGTWHSARSATDPACALAAAGADWSRDSDCPGAAVSNGAVRLVLGADV